MGYHPAIFTLHDLPVHPENGANVSCSADSAPMGWDGTAEFGASGRQIEHVLKETETSVLALAQHPKTAAPEVWSAVRDEAVIKYQRNSVGFQKFACRSFATDLKQHSSQQLVVAELGLVRQEDTFWSSERR